MRIIFLEYKNQCSAEVVSILEQDQTSNEKKVDDEEREIFLKK